MVSPELREAGFAVRTLHPCGRGSRVPQGAFERLELHEWKHSRVVLRGGGGGNATSLPAPRGAILWGDPARNSCPRELRQALREPSGRPLHGGDWHARGPGVGLTV